MRRQVVEVQCARCARKQLVDESTVTDFFQATLNSTVIEFEDLCTPCFKTIEKLLEAISRKIDGLSPDRQMKRKKKEIGAKEKSQMTSSPSTAVSPQPPGTASRS